MKSKSGSTVSPWTKGFDMPSFQRLKTSRTADVCVVGAGITGLTTAYCLAAEGRSVVVVDSGEVGGGETGRTTAHLVNALDDRFYELERLHGKQGAKLAAASHSAAIDKIEAIVAEEKRDCDFLRLDGYLFEPPDGDPANLERELQACHRAGLIGVEMVPRTPLSYDTGPALRFPRQAQFHPMKYLQTLVEGIQRRGGTIYTQTRITQVRGAQPCEAVTEDERVISADAIVVATNSPINDRLVIHTKQEAYRTYVVGARVPKDSVTLALYWDTPNPYHYIRLQKTLETEESASDLLIVGGEDHKTGQPPEDPNEPFNRLEAWTKERFPKARKFEFRWSGQVMEPVDSLAFIGRNPLDDSNVYVATGDSGNGMTHGTIAGMLLTDLIAGRHNDWAELYDPRRKTLQSIPQYAAANLNAAAQYGDWIGPGEVDSMDSIPNDSGAVVRGGATKQAVFRDSEGQLHICSAVCPHVGCIVGWNKVEKTWDCPCHGSRFDRFGEVIAGPAAIRLEAIPEKSEAAAD